MIFADRFAYGAGIYTVLWIGALITGIGWGLVESVVNPLIATLYPNKKTGMLNALHAWWPGGIVIGSLLGAGTLNIHLGWQLKLAVACIPAIGVIALSRGLRFPSTKRADSRGSIGELFSELASPLFVILFLSMMLTAAAEFAPGQWLDATWTRTLHMKGIGLSVYVSGLMFVMRHFAGVLERWLSPMGVLCLSCVLASIGLLALSIGGTPWIGLVGATLWGTGVCFLWPTMLAAASGRFPRGGATLFGLMGTAGTLSIQFILPSMCAIFNTTKVAAAGGEARFNALKVAELDRVFQVATQTSFLAVAILPALLVLVFGGIWYYDRSKGGFKAAKLS
jgi:fucose permease